MEWWINLSVVGLVGSFEKNGAEIDNCRPSSSLLLVLFAMQNQHNNLQAWRSEQSSLYLVLSNVQTRGFPAHLQSRKARQQSMLCLLLIPSRNGVDHRWRTLKKTAMTVGIKREKKVALHGSEAERKRIEQRPKKAKGRDFRGGVFQRHYCRFSCWRESLILDRIHPLCITRVLFTKVGFTTAMVEWRPLEKKASDQTCLALWKNSSWSS